jgi:hypothetical protein
VLRGAALAVCSAALTVAAHATAGGGVDGGGGGGEGGAVAAMPSPGLTLVLTVLLAGLGIALADRRRGFPLILVAVGGSQLGMHLLLAGLGHGHGGAAPMSIAMVGLHAVAAVFTAVLLTGAEDAVFAVVGVLRWILSAVTVAARPVPTHRPVDSGIPGPMVPGSLVVDVLLRRVHGRRGPPCLV